jgi:hypothetical protein
MLPIDLPEVSCPLPVRLALLPGPNRKRTASPYTYRVTYRNPEPGEPGCVLLWEVSGGRLRYQIALEKQETGTLQLHCTCADAIYRAESEGRFCKHVRGLLDFFQGGLIGQERPVLVRASG